MRFLKGGRRLGGFFMRNVAFHFRIESCGVGIWVVDIFFGMAFLCNTLFYFILWAFFDYSISSFLTCMILACEYAPRLHRHLLYIFLNLIHHLQTSLLSIYEYQCPINRCVYIHTPTHKPND